MGNVYLWVAIIVPILFVIGVVYNALKDQHKLESTTLKEVLKERARRQSLPPDHPDYLYVKPYDDDELTTSPSHTSAKTAPASADTEAQTASAVTKAAHATPAPEKTATSASTAKTATTATTAMTATTAPNSRSQSSCYLDQVDHSPLSALPDSKPNIHAASYFARK